jgi:hypothetical protein
MFQKCPKFIIPQNNALLNKIYNISESGDVKILYLEIVSFSRNFGRMSFFGKSPALY